MADYIRLYAFLSQVLTFADPVRFNKPAAVLVHAGRIWIADLDNHRIMVVTLSD